MLPLASPEFSQPIQQPADRIADEIFQLGAKTMNVLRLAILVHVAVVSVGCALFLTSEARYLLAATDRASREDVQRHLGPPLHVASNEAGETVWHYEIREYVEGGNNSWTMVGAWWCDT
jgi:hypothetical protein